MLSGLLNNRIVEVTNCFPIPSMDDDDFNECEYTYIVGVRIHRVIHRVE